MSYTRWLQNGAGIGQLRLVGLVGEVTQFSVIQIAT